MEIDIDSAVLPPFDELLWPKSRAFEKKNPEAALKELVDREEIRELIAVYAHRVAHGRSVADLFTDDGSYVVRRPGREMTEVSGRAHLDSHFLNGLESLKGLDRPLPMLHNLLVKIDGDDAISLCSNELRMSDNGESMIGSGYYKDTLRRENGQWKFVVRDMTFIHYIPLVPGWTNPKQ
jgi:hypothetical protein